MKPAALFGGDFNTYVLWSVILETHDTSGGHSDAIRTSSSRLSVFSGDTVNNDSYRAFRPPI